MSWIDKTLLSRLFGGQAKAVFPKYELTDNAIDLRTPRGNNIKLYQIRATRKIPTPEGDAVQKGQLGGYVQSEDNLSQEGNAWVGYGAYVYQQARVTGDALVGTTTRQKTSGHIEIRGAAIVDGDTTIQGRDILMPEHVLGLERSLDSARP